MGDLSLPIAIGISKGEVIPIAIGRMSAVPVCDLSLPIAIGISKGEVIPIAIGRMSAVIVCDVYRPLQRGEVEKVVII